MLKKYSMLMMLLIGTASLIGISSSIYQPANVETQPQQIPGTEGLITRQQKENMDQYMADSQLLDRIMPIIIKRIDGKTLAQKIDAATLLQKIDAKTLAAKVLPYLDLNVALTQRPGQIGSIKVGALAPGGAAWGKAGCPPGETAVSAGFTHQAKGDLSVFSLYRTDPNSNAWDVTTDFDDTGKVFTYAECLKVELALKEPQQPQQSEQQPPGGPPLRPPSNP
jgi:hypothetical protein